MSRTCKKTSDFWCCKIIMLIACKNSLNMLTAVISPKLHFTKYIASCYFLLIHKSLEFIILEGSSRTRSVAQPSTRCRKQGVRRLRDASQIKGPPPIIFSCWQQFKCSTESVAGFKVYIAKCDYFCWNEVVLSQ